MYKSLIKLLFVVILPVACVTLLINIMVYPYDVTTLQTVIITMSTTLSIFIGIAMWNISPNVNMLPNISYQIVPIITLGIGIHPETLRSVLIFLPLLTIEIGGKRRKYINKVSYPDH